MERRARAARGADWFVHVERGGGSGGAGCRTNIVGALLRAAVHHREESRAILKIRCTHCDPARCRGIHFFHRDAVIEHPKEPFLMWCENQ
jgi:hypothetical protein